MSKSGTAAVTAAKDVSQLLAAALRARDNAYTPYSHFHVGAALIDDQSRVFTGCNVENSSYGATICAERNAVGAMVAAGGRFVREIVVVTDTAEGSTPCGICRQVLMEFTEDPTKTKVHIANLKGVQKTFTMEQMLPEAFSKEHLVAAPKAKV